MEHTAAILFGSLAAVIIVGYTVYRALKSHQLRKRLENEAWQRHIGKPIPWENKTRSRPSAIELGNQIHRHAEQELLYRQQVGRTERTKIEGHPSYNMLFPSSSFELPDTGFAREPDLGPSPFDSHKSSFEGGGGSFGGGGASDSWGSSDSCSSSDSGGSNEGGGGNCGGSSD